MLCQQKYKHFFIFNFIVYLYWIPLQQLLNDFCRTGFILNELPFSKIQRTNEHWTLAIRERVPRLELSISWVRNDSMKCLKCSSLIVNVFARILIPGVQCQNNSQLTILAAHFVSVAFVQLKVGPIFPIRCWIMLSVIFRKYFL